MKPALFATCLLMTVACTREAANDEPAPPSAAPSPAPAVDMHEPTAEQVPVPLDFVDEAKTSITQASYKAELAALAQEIEASDGQ